MTIMKRSISGFSLICAIVGTTVALSTSAVLAETIPVTGAITTTSITGSVVAVDQEQRILTIRNLEGRFQVLHVPAEVGALDQIKIGNSLSVDKTQAILVDIKKGGDKAPIGSTKEVTVDREPGTKPSGTIVDTTTLTGRVESVDRANSTVTVRGPNSTQVFSVKDQSLLKSVAPGDSVEATYMQVISGEVKFR